MAASGIGLIFEDSGSGLNDTSYIEANGSHERIRARLAFSASTLADDGFRDL